MPSTLDDLEVEFDYVQNSYRWDYLWFRAPAGSDEFLRVEEVEGNTVPHELTRRGDRWQVAVVSNETGLQTVQKLLDETDIITIANSPPIVEVTLDNTSPSTVDAVIATATHTDADGDEVDYDYIWQRQDGFQTNLPSLDPANTSVGDYWKVTVTGSDNADPPGFSEEVVADFMVRNSSPKIELLELTEGPTYKDGEIRVEVTASDPDDEQSLTHSIEWVVNGQVALSNTPRITGEHFSKGQEVVARVSTFDGVTASPQEASETRLISNTAPYLVHTNNTSDPLREGDVADCSESSGHYEAHDIDSDAVSVTVEWEVNGQTIGETTDQLSSDFFQKSDTVRCLVTPSDEETPGDPVVILFGQVLNTAPEVTGLTLSPTGPGTGDSITAIPTDVTDVDSQDTVTLEYTWTKNGVPQQIGPSDTLDNSYFTRGELIGVEVIANDGTEDSAGVSTSVTIANSPPAVDSVSLLNFQHQVIRTNNTAVARPEGSDVDEDFIQYFYDWSVNGVLVFTGTSNLLDSSNFEKNDTITVGVTPHDGTHSGSQFAESVVVANTPPTQPFLWLDAQIQTPGPDPTLWVASDFHCLILVDSTDADNDPITYSFQWEKDGVAYMDGYQADSDYESFLSTADVYPQQEWTCIATSYDSEESGGTGTRSFEVPAPCGSVVMNNSDYAYTTSFPSMTSNQFTAEFWFKTFDLSSTTDGQRLMQIGSGGTHSVEFCNDGFTITAFGSSYGGTCNNYLGLEQWHHLAVRIRGNGQVSVLLDGGQELPLLDGPGTTAYSAGNSITFGNQLKGSLGDVRIWDERRSDAEILSGMYDWPLASDEPTLAAWWPFVDGGGQNIATSLDWTNNGHNAYMVGPSWNFSLMDCPEEP